jgi:phage terminase large subunit GpA-like protein
MKTLVIKEARFNEVDVLEEVNDIEDDFQLEYADTDEIVCDVAEILRPSNKRTVVEACKSSLKVSSPGGYSGPWSEELTPYMVEAMNCLKSREYEAVIFVAPARTGKTEGLLDGWCCSTVIDDPGDMMIVQPSKDAARDYSIRRISRMLRNSPDLTEMQTGSTSDDNTFDKRFKNGMILSLGWPTISQLSGKDIKYMGVSDYDRMPDNVDGEGSVFAQALKRTQTFLSGGMTLIESSPGWEISDPKYKEDPDTHEGPPCKGIMALYNEGDRRKLYWKCKHCEEYFQPLFRNLHYSESERSFVKQAATVKLTCTCCGAMHEPKDKFDLNQTGVWLAEGQNIRSDGTIYGEKRESKIASFWMEGVPAAFQTWEDLIYKYLKAESTYERTGDEESLKATVTLDQGRPYMSKALQHARDPNEIESRVEDLEKRVVPEGVRFLTASIDVQGGVKSRFVVQVVGWGPSKDGTKYETWLIDRYNLRYSKRKIDDSDESPEARMEYIDPARYAEDWEILIPKVIERAYPLEGDPKKEMRIKITGCDSGGEDGVTDMAYQFQKTIRKKALHKRFFLVKGASRVDAPRFKVTYPDSSKKKGRKTISSGDVPLTMVNTMVLKDRISGNMERAQRGPGYMHHPKWLGSWFYDELTYEVRTDKGWIKPGRGNNEAFDLYVYCTTGYLKIGGEKIKWDSPPSWAREWESNSMVQEVIEPVEEEVGSLDDKPLQYTTQKPSRPQQRNVRRFR